MNEGPSQRSTATGDALIEPPKKSLPSRHNCAHRHDGGRPGNGAAMAKGDPREAVALTPAEVGTLLAGMRTYLETIQGIIEVMAESNITRVSAIASKAGSKLLQTTSPMMALKVPLGFTSMSLDTHDKFDQLAKKAEQGASRTEILADLGTIMSNCVSCHASYRLVSAGRHAN